MTMSCLSPPLPEVLHLLLLAQWPEEELFEERYNSEVISFLPKSPDTLCDLNMAMAPGKNKELHYHISLN